MKKYKMFEIETEEGTFMVKTPASKVTVDYARVIALHWLKKQHNVMANKLINVNGV